jgi:hypothetical protein
MLNPFLESDENARDTDKFISTNSVRIIKKNNYPITYIIVGLIYVLEILTSVIGGMNDNNNTGLFKYGLILQYFLMSSGLYAILGLIAEYQFNQKVYLNKLYFLLYDFIKICWICIGCGILFGYNQIMNCNFIIGYSLFYILYSILYVICSVIKTIRLSQHDYY